MFAPANPPRVASNVAPVTRVSVFAARGMLPAASPIPFSVVRLDSPPEPRIDAPPGPIVTFDIVLAVAERSPAMEGETCPLTPSFHRSLEPGLRIVRPHRVGRALGAHGRHLHRGEHREIPRELEVRDQLALGALTLHAPPRRS